MEYVYRMSDGLYLCEYYSKKDLIQQEDCYIAKEKPFFGYDAEVYYNISTGLERYNENKKRS